MKIIYVENVRVPSERAHAYQIVQTCAWLARLGHDVTLVNPSRAGGQDVFDAYGLSKGLFAHVALPAWDPLSVPWVKPKAISYALQRWAFTRAARSWSTAQSPDAWYTRDPAMIDALPHVGPWILELHDAPDNNPARWERMKARIRAFVVISHGLKDKLVSLGIPASNICVAPDGFDPALFAKTGDRHAERTALDIPADAFVAMYAGSFYPWKGVDLVVYAWSRTDRSSHLVLIGGPDTDRARIARLAGPRVHILPTVDRERAIAMLAAADVGLLTSSPHTTIGKMYTSPLKQFEYLAAGLPVLASDVPSSHEILDDRVARFYQPEEEAFLRALESVRLDSVWRSEARQIARIVVIPYTWEARTRTIEQCMREHL